MTPPHGVKMTPGQFLEAMAKEVGKGLLRSGVKALARGVHGALESVAEDGDVVLEKADQVADVVKNRIADFRRRSGGPPR